jgi:hypothetical protein
MRIGLSHRGAVLALYLLGAVFTVLGCGVLLGRVIWFAWAAGLGIATAIAIASLARRAPERPGVDETRSLPPARQRARAPRTADGVAVRVVPVATRGEARAEEVLAALPPAAGHPN